MSAVEITDAFVSQMEKQTNFIAVNYANGDMVGHTGNFKATVTSLECLDDCLKRIEEAAYEQGYQVFITGDHGNCEAMYDAQTDSPITSHTLNPVYFLKLEKDSNKNLSIENGKLGDIAPTLLSQMNLPTPEEMNGDNLIK